MAPILKIYFFASSPEPKSQLTPNMAGSIRVTYRSKIAKVVPVGDPRWPPWQPSWKSIFGFFTWTERPNLLGSIRVTCLSNHHESCTKCLSWWFLDQVWNWVTWGQKLGHLAKFAENLITLVITFLKQSSWILLKMFVLMILSQVQNWVTWGQKLGHLAKSAKTLLTL